MSRSVRPAPAWAGGTIMVAVAIPVCIAFVDRPVAFWAHAHLLGVASTGWLNWTAEPGPILLLPALVVASCLRGVGGRGGGGFTTLIACIAATLLAVLIKDQLKIACGRTWPESWMQDNPSLIRDGVYGFFPFHGTPGWTSFPSGHTATIAAPVAVLWQLAPHRRGLWAGALGAMIAALLIGNYHFVSDIIAGAYIGIVSGGITLAVMQAVSRRRAAPAGRAPDHRPAPRRP